MADLPADVVKYLELKAQNAGRDRAHSIAEKFGALNLVEQLKTKREELRRWLRVEVGAPALEVGADRKVVAHLTNLAWRAFADEATFIAANGAEPTSRPN